MQALLPKLHSAVYSSRHLQARILLSPRYRQLVMKRCVLARHRIVPVSHLTADFSLQSYSYSQFSFNRLADMASDLTPQFGKHLHSVSSRHTEAFSMYLLIKILLTTFGPSPFVKAPIPSSLPIRTNPFKAFGYKYCSAVGFTPSAHIRTKTTYIPRKNNGGLFRRRNDRTSVGFPINPASPPATPAHMTVDVDESFAPVRC